MNEGYRWEGCEYDGNRLGKISIRCPYLRRHQPSISHHQKSEKIILSNWDPRTDATDGRADKGTWMAGSSNFIDYSNAVKPAFSVVA